MLYKEEIDCITVYLNLLDMLYTTSGIKDSTCIGTFYKCFLFMDKKIDIGYYTVQKVLESSEGD